MFKNKIRNYLTIILMSYASLSVADESIRVYAAASLNNVITEISKNYQQEFGKSIKSSFASSSTLAKQIDLGAPADIFISADTQWMDYLQQHHKLQNTSRKNLLGNTLVLISPKNSPKQVNMNKNYNLAKAFTGRFCMGDPQSVPAGIYAKQALTYFQWWLNIEKRLVLTEDVRSALAFVERAECELGIVYKTDAQISQKVLVVGQFPEQSHQKIIYPMALLEGASTTSVKFYQYLQTEKAKAVFIKYGFSVFDMVSK